MPDLSYNGREFLALAGLALSVPAISSAFAESPEEIECLVYDDQGQPLPPSALERFHLCDSLMRPFTMAFETAPGEVQFRPPDKPFRIGLPLSVPGFGQVFVYADDSGAGYTGRSLAHAAPLILNYALARDRMATVRTLLGECKQRDHYTTLPIYEGWVEKEKGHPHYSALEAALTTLVGSTVLPNGHPCIWLEPENTPKWLENIPYEETKHYCLEHVRQAISRYRHRIHIWDVVNELHVQPDVDRGMAGFTREQNVDRTVSALKIAREADPTCFRIVNNTGTWADYYMGEHPAGTQWQRRPAPWQQSPYDYLAMLRDAKADYEAIGLQYYHSGRDLVKWERDLERFNNFGKPIHITEMGFPSSLAPFPGQGKYAFWGGVTAARPGVAWRLYGNHPGGLCRVGLHHRVQQTSGRSHQLGLQWHRSRRVHPRRWPSARKLPSPHGIVCEMAKSSMNGRTEN